MQTAPAADDDRLDAAKEEPRQATAERARAEVLTLTGPGGCWAGSLGERWRASSTPTWAMPGPTGTGRDGGNTRTGSGRRP